jgi:hypothetical protein
MARYLIPPNSGKVRVAMGQAGTFAVWNGKQGKDEFRILVRERKTAEELKRVINARQHFGALDVVEPTVLIVPEDQAKAAITQEARPSRTRRRQEEG